MGFPRRLMLNEMTPAEKAIYEAGQLIEKMGADVRLTTAQIKLQEARDLVADYVDRENLEQQILNNTKSLETLDRLADELDRLTFQHPTINLKPSELYYIINNWFKPKIDRIQNEITHLKDLRNHIVHGTSDWCDFGSRITGLEKSLELLAGGVVENFAHELPKSQLAKALNKHNVMGRSELLLAFCKEYHQKFGFTRADDAQPLIDAFLSKQ